MKTRSQGLPGPLQKAGNKLAQLKTHYDKAETNVEKIAGMLEDHQVQLLKDIAMLDQMYALNLIYFKELTMYILAGKQRLERGARHRPAGADREGPALRLAGGRPGGQRPCRHVRPV